MRDVLSELIDLLHLEQIEATIFRGPSQDLGWGQVFGGQVLGQALSAAQRTVPADRHCHSLHGYFLRSGDVSQPVVYTVDCIRDGRSFTTRRVVALQHGKAIFNLSCSFQISEQGLEHQDEMPDVPGPEGLKSSRELLQAAAQTLPPPLRPWANAERPLELRPVSPQNPMAPRVREPTRYTWLRAARPLPDDPDVHRYLLAYASDFSFLTTSLQPHGVSWLTPGMQVTSLDHAMWFRGDFRLDDWLLYAIDSPWAGGARGLVRGRFFTRDGRLVASTAQEGLIRDRRK